MTNTQISSEPMYQEILPKAELMDSLSQPKEIPGSTVTAENDFYETVLHSQQLPQWKEDYDNVMPSGCPMPFQTFQHSEQ